MKYSTITFISGLGISLFLLIYSSSCDREPVYIGNLPDGSPSDSSAHPCSPDSVYFSAQVLPILQSNCAMADCHDAVSANDGVVLDNYANTRNTGGIKVSNPTDSKIYKVLIDSDPDDRMPPAPQSPLSADQRNLILKWIQQGALNLSCDAACDTSNVTFSAAVKPLIGLYCQGCHSGANPSGGIALSNFTEIKNVASSGKLLGSIKHSTGFKPMPYPAGSNKLSVCNTRKIEIWIAKGMKND